ncbi:transcriptional regulator [Longispora fulva]|uniref:Transcriptional regulator with XRE-family HTH domain n=1 Tax=Longispora fulva TaxID=619741 RepID=A0A8J7KLV0_9ACTN|nr:transcriptional regulator with XRE-family HTH domain [Longispora fulva]GIG57812.1 transcriptional regulator [Longispora fulva]
MLNPADRARAQATPRRVLLRSALGDTLRRMRLEQGRTLADVALRARVSMPYLSELERGLKEASSEVLAALCAALGIELSDLLVAIAFQISAESVVATPAPIRRMTAGHFEVATSPVRRAGDAYALAA